MIFKMVNMPENMHKNQTKEKQSNSIPLATFSSTKDGMNGHGCSSGDSSAFSSPNGAEDSSQKSLLSNSNSSKHASNGQHMMMKPMPKKRTPLSNMIGSDYTPTARSSIEDDKAYTNIPLSPLSTDETVMNDSLTTAGNRMVTMTGTIRRGQKPVQVQLQLSDREVKTLNRASMIEQDKNSDCVWGLRKGLHVVVLSLLYVPFAFISSLVMCFYVGTVCWYNIYLYLSEERTIWHKIFFCPVLILFYPFLIVILSLSLAMFAALKQISWYFASWYREIKDFDKGFYGWLCSKLDISECAPYEVVIIDEHLTSPQSIGDTTAAQTMV